MMLHVAVADVSHIQWRWARALEHLGGRVTIMGIAVVLYLTPFTLAPVPRDGGFCHHTHDT